MTAVVRWSGREARILRDALRMSVREFAAHLGYTTAAVSSWERRGEQGRLRAQTQRDLDTALRLAGDEVRERFARALSAATSAPRDSSGDDPGGRRDGVTRRVLLGGGLVALPTLGLDDLRHIAMAMEDGYRYLDGSVVGHLRTQLGACAADDGRSGPRSTLPTVLGLVGVVEQSARRVKSHVRRELLTVGAQCAEFAGWLYRDGGESQVGEYWRDRAMEWAQAAGDRAMQGYILLRKSQAAWDQRDAARMLTLAEAVSDGDWRLPAGIRSEAAQQAARGHAMLGDPFERVRRQLDRARELLYDGADPDEAPLGTGYREAVLSVQTAMCYHEAGQPHEAVAIYREALDTTRFSRRDYGYFMSLHASALASAGEPDDAADAGLVAHGIAAATGSARTAVELGRLVRQLDAWTDRPAVRELRQAVGAG